MSSVSIFDLGGMINKVIIFMLKLSGVLIKTLSLRKGQTWVETPFLNFYCVLQDLTLIISN